MLGVVLWSDEQDQKAVIWCEDQGDLAYWKSDAATPVQTPFDAGDLVQFDMEIMPTMRKAHNPKLVIEQAAKSLPQALRASSAECRKPPQSGRVIPFVQRTGRGRNAGADPKRTRKEG
jgi:ketopantoate reductase